MQSGRIEDLTSLQPFLPQNQNNRKQTKMLGMETVGLLQWSLQPAIPTYKIQHVKDPDGIQTAHTHIQEPISLHSLWAVNSLWKSNGNVA